ncbi:MAG: hypothetical protein VKO21_10450 [Candidatus Sericytochromatia bacterium]|nr:hypothetical protein [Candidatus Sericytochromatia bacterium]
MARKNLATRLTIGGLLAATALGCASSPTQQPPTGQPPAGNVTVPVASELGGGGNPTSPSSGAAVAPIAPAVPIPGLSIGAAPTMLPFVSVIGGQKQLFVYDRTISDNYALVGAGIGVNNPEVFSSGRVIFDRRQGRRSQIFVYDVVAELLVALNDVNGLGSVRRPSMSFDGTAMTFILESERRDDVPKAMLWLNGVVADLAKVNAQGSCEGGINWIRISCDARWAVFTTLAGRLYVYDMLNPMIHEIAQARLYGQISHPAISPDGTQIAFAASDGNVYRYDRVANLVDPMPFLNYAFTNYDVTDPKFVCFDNAHIYTEMLTRGGDILTNRLPDPKCEDDDCREEGDSGHGGPRPPRTLVRRVTEYNWITETLATLTVLNNVAAEGDQQISDLGDYDRDHGGGHGGR